MFRFTRVGERPEPCPEMQLQEGLGRKCLAVLTVREAAVPLACTWLFASGALSRQRPSDPVPLCTCLSETALKAIWSHGLFSLSKAHGGAEGVP